MSPDDTLTLTTLLVAVAVPSVVTFVACRWVIRHLPAWGALWRLLTRDVDPARAAAREVRLRAAMRRHPAGGDRT